MEPFLHHTGVVAPLDRANIDTDAIIPKQYLKSIRRTGFATGLFSDWRYGPDGAPNPDFVLNHPAYLGATILLTRHNFGCGSSREHAVWAVRQFGFRVVIAPRMGEGATGLPAFADIFRGNSLRNGLLCIELDAETVDRCFAAVQASPGISAAVDLASQTLRLPAEAATPLRFDIDASAKNTLLHGLDDIAMTLADIDLIGDYELRNSALSPQSPWGESP